MLVLGGSIRQESGKKQLKSALCRPIKSMPHASPRSTVFFSLVKNQVTTGQWTWASHSLVFWTAQKLLLIKVEMKGCRGIMMDDGASSYISCLIFFEKCSGFLHFTINFLTIFLGMSMSCLALHRARRAHPVIGHSSQGVAWWYWSIGECTTAWSVHHS